MGLELRADDDVEASLRVSCFQFGPKGLATMEAEPLPPNITDEDEDEDDDDDDEDPLGIGERECFINFLGIFENEKENLSRYIIFRDKKS